jgi:LysR family glycine cleavage system transcriptional activator
MRQAKKRISLRGLRTFCIVARRASFRLAAEDLFLTPSAISHQIKVLEDEADVKLFDRSARVLRLTEAGDMLFRESEGLIAELDEVASRFHTRYGQRPLHVTVQPFFATEMLVPRLSTFISDNPDVQISLDTEAQTASAHPLQTDISIRLFRKTPKDLRADELFRLRLVPACSPAFLEKNPGVCKLSMSKLPLIVHSKRPNAWRDWHQAIGVDMDERSSVIRLETMISVARAAEQGLGVALVPLPLSESWFKSQKLVRLSEFELDTPDRYLVVTRDDEGERSEVRIFRQWILKEFGHP